MKKLEFTILPLLVMLSLSPAAGQSLPATSQAHPDVLGIKVGISTFNDVRSIFDGTALALRVEEHRTPLWGALSTGIGNVGIPNSEYVEELRGVSKTYQGPDNSPCGQFGSNCQYLRVWFSAPPNAGTVLAITRFIHFADGPLTSTVVKDLVDRYGQQEWRDSAGDKGVEQHLVWAWAPNGSAMTLNGRHICASRGAADMRSIDGMYQSVASMSQSDDSKSVLQAGCAAMLTVIIHQENSITTDETIDLIDHYGILAALTNTRAFVARGVASYEECERQHAATRGVPNELSDQPNSTKAIPPSVDSSSSCAAAMNPWTKAGPCDRACGFITVNVTGTPGPISVDFVRAGRTPLISYKVRPGLHRISVWVGRDMVNESVQIDSGATVVKSFEAAQR